MMCPLCSAELRQVRLTVHTADALRVEGERYALECLHCGVIATSNVVSSHGSLIATLIRIKRLQDDWRHGRGITFTLATAAARIQSALDGGQ